MDIPASPVASPAVNGALGVQRGSDRIETAAAKLASADQVNGSEDRSVEALIELQAGKQQAQASTKAISAENDVIGSLLSVRA